jgi:hypothetical protein
MSRIHWSGDIEQRRIELQNAGNSMKKIASILSIEFNKIITKDMVAGRKKVVKNKKIKQFNNMQQTIF